MLQKLQGSKLAASRVSFSISGNKISSHQRKWSVLHTLPRL